jgi:choline dehydrogenase
MIDSTGADYIVVGAGAAGCVLAHRLGAAGRSVLLLEAGPTDQLAAIHATDIGSMTSLWGPGEVNWGYETAPQPGLAGRTVAIAQGRVLGGGSAINAMMYVRGNPGDFDRWAADGATGWSYNDVLKLFRRTEDYPSGDVDYRGRGGALKVIDYPGPCQASLAFMAAAREVGRAGPPADYNGPRQQGVAFAYQSTRTEPARRCSTADAFLPANGVTVIAGCLVTRVLTVGGAAVGVECRRAGEMVHYRAEREVVVCAGTFASPKLLMLSGIGPAGLLHGLGIDVLADRPAVGENLQDHLLLGVGYESLVPLSEAQLLSEVGLFTSTQSLSLDARPDLQFFFGPVQFFDPAQRIDGPAFTFAPILAQPKSRGRVTLHSADPAALPLVDPNYLGDPADLAVLVRGIEIAREIAAAAAFSGIAGRELAPGPATSGGDLLADYVRRSASTVWHPVGTCRMGADPASVVDPALRVRGVAALRVADASVMPAITTGNTNAATMMIAEKAADLILG